MNFLSRIKLKILRGEYEFTRHTLFDKLPLYGFTTDDILNAVETCESVIKQTDDVRGVRYVILGRALNGVNIEVVCRLAGDKILFITIYDYE
ncbi:MAG: DUF4258 domain-containing protein [Pyrinomonadaceae bacterium]|nr:DUF4258 domain-containing protein [Pyrinomonadaceae bacterium]